MLEAAKAKTLSDGLRLMIEPAPANKSSQTQAQAQANSAVLGVTSFVGEACRLIEILVGTGHKAEAEAIRNQPWLGWTTHVLKSAVSDAEERVRQRSPQGKEEKNSGAPLPP